MAQPAHPDKGIAHPGAGVEPRTDRQPRRFGRSARLGWTPGARRGELALIVALLGLAAAVRLPYLWDIPRFTDETAEARIALWIVRGEAFPLTNRDPYIGALWNYLLAAAFLVGGPSLYTPRTLIAVFGTLAVVPAYLLGRSIDGPDRGRGVGPLAALLLALAPAHIAVNSHIAWSNCLTPIFTTLGLWLTGEAIARDRPQLLALAGLAFGLAVQTHPTGILLLPGVAVGVALARRRWLLSCWPWLAVAVAVLACANLLVPSDRGDVAGLGAGAAVQEQYTGGETLTPAVYGDRLRQELILLTDSMGGALVETGTSNDLPTRALGIVLLGVATAGLATLSRRQQSLLLLAVVSYLLLLPIVNGRYESTVPKARYIAPLLPLCYVGIGVLIRESIGWIGSQRTARVWSLRLVVVDGLVAAVLVLVVGPLLGLVGYYRAAAHDDRTNAVFYAAVRGIQSSLKPGDRVYIDRPLLQEYVLGGGQWGEHLAFAASIFGWERQPVDLPSPVAATVPRIVGPLVVRGSWLSRAAQVYQLISPPDGPPDGAVVRVVRSEGIQPVLSTIRRAESRAVLPEPESLPRSVPFVSGVAFPSGLRFAPDGRLFFAEVLEGRVRIASAEGDLQQAPFVVLPTTRGLEQGVLGLALDTDFAANHWVYVFYSEADANNRPIRNRVVRFTERDGQASESTAILASLPINQTRLFNGDHNGGPMAFGPDGKLYVSVGEMTQRNRVADPATVYGKILRINKDGSTPSDNPFAPYSTYAVGFRNVFGLAFHPLTGQLYVTDNGPRGFDELDLVLPGRNYGYPTVEEGAGHLPGLVDPIWDSGEERLGITGAAFYTGTLFPEYTGNLFFCAFNTGALRRAVLGGPAQDQVQWVDTISNDCRLDVVDGPDGTLYFSDLARIYRLAR